MECFFSLLFFSLKHGPSVDTYQAVERVRNQEVVFGKNIKYEFPSSTFHFTLGRATLVKLQWEMKQTPFSVEMGMGILLEIIWTPMLIVLN